ncbi:MAG: hypothetical protein LBF89_05750 [Bacteroidales bacterium]|jgi:hypothetical protein|nr:hypothetical protein [Bacteroidales bacterium]
MIHPVSFYQERMRRFADEEASLARQNTRYAWLRLSLFTAGIAGGIYGGSYSPVAGVIVAVTFAAGFLLCVKKHGSIVERQKEAERLKSVNRWELNSLNGDDSAFPSGERYMDAAHPYTSDLDIFGAHSVFRHVNRTTSPSGSDLLASWLCRAAPTPEIEHRQQAVKELAEMVDWRQKMQAVGLKYKDTAGALPEFLLWLKSRPVLSGRRRLLWAMRVLPWITLSCAALAVAGWLPAGCLWLLIAVHLTIAGTTFRQVNALHGQVSNKVAFLSIYAEIIAPVVAVAGFSSPRMTALRQVFTGSDAPAQIRALRDRIRRLDYRLNMIYFPVNLLFFFDFKHLVWLEKWRITSGEALPEWFDAIAAIEALSSFANLSFNNPGWTMPVIRDDYCTIETVQAGHPLIGENERICNDFSTGGRGMITIVTGSNMSGKSTFLRSIGVNMALALAGAPVCAAKFVVSNCLLYTYMRIADHLEERTSSFYAELKRLKTLIDITRNGEHVFFLLDEILRGTNSRDRQTGSVALIRQLVRQQTSGVIATHDLTLGELQAELPDHIRNAHFDVQINGENMAFDYRLHEGICSSLNASVLMKKIGIEI